MEYVPFPVLKLLFPITEKVEVRERPLQVLCLGLGRTGTDSLRTALLQLGYHDVDHGFRIVEAVGRSPQWCRLALAKRKFPNAAFLNRDEFDKVIGDCEAVTDVGCAGFGVELLRAYPEAKVVLNRRRDIDAWYRSTMKTLAPMYQDWESWFRRWFDGECFWIYHLAQWCLKAVFDFDIAKNAKAVYSRHYAELEAELREQGRPWLDWTVEDGWEPLCEFLGKPVPDVEFPNENNVDSFAQRRAKLHAARIARARRNMRLTGIVLVAVFVIMAAWTLRKVQ